MDYYSPKNDVLTFFLSTPFTEVILVVLAALGFMRLVRFTSQLLFGLWVTFLRSGKDVRKYGSWAIVTGATDGIGKGFAKELAKKKVNVVLVSRTESKLVEVSKELETKYKIQTKVVAIDFVEADLGVAIKKIEDAISDLDVGILINNVGLSYNHAQFFHELDAQLMLDLIKVNIIATTRITKLVLPGMLNRRRGAIVNIGSGAATVLPSDPLYAVYAGTKGYVDQFSRTLYVEYKSCGIDVQCQAPLYVATKLSKIRKSSLTCPSADTYARYGLRWIGLEPRVTPYWVHSIMWWMIASLPETIMDAVRLRQSTAIRKRALAKLSQKKAQ
eukprot:TRINITY_DN23034_c0_g1_i1.p1 TRINITY_DN23034_c0_g1~~TRINITY_DN23034_c0_g1_i1.p1  ORF type:complete len:330 (+),score=54.70 TRINITY_DN23034_c0_g1_i1:69-1058(+)